MILTANYAGLLAIIFLVLSIRALIRRRESRIPLGQESDKGRDKELLKRVRAHANFTEYTPLALILCALIESQLGQHSLIHAIGLSLLIGRLVHAYGVSQYKENYRFRVVGMSFTFLAYVFSIFGVILINVS